MPYSWRTVICNRNDSAERQQIQRFVGRSLAFYCQSLISQEDTRRHIKAKTSDFRETDTNLYLGDSDRLTDPCYERHKRQSLHWLTQKRFQNRNASAIFWLIKLRQHDFQSGRVATNKVLIMPSSN